MNLLKSKKNRYNRKLNKLVGMSSVEYTTIKRKDVDLSKSVLSFIKRCKPDIYNFNIFYDKEVNYLFDRIKILRKEERNLHGYSIRSIKNDKEIEVYRLSKMKEKLLKKIDEKGLRIKGTSPSIVPFIPVIALIGDFINIFSKFETILVQSTIISTILTTMICIVLDISPLELKTLLKDGFNKNKIKIITLFSVITITSIIYLIICIGTIDSLYSSTTILSGKKNMSMAELMVAILIAILPLLSTGLILGMSCKTSLSEMVKYILDYLTIRFDKYKLINVELQIEALNRDLLIDYEKIDNEQYELILKEDQVLKESELYHCKKLFVLEVDNSPEVIDMLMKIEEGDKDEKDN